MSFLDFFVDPILRGPTLGCMLMGVSSSLLGVVFFLKKRSLLAETLSHCSYPGVMAALWAMAVFWPDRENEAFGALLVGAFLAAGLAWKGVDLLERKGGARPDTALTFLLAVFFGGGLVLQSFLQGSFPKWQKQAQMLLLGQAAILQDFHIWLYGLSSVVVAVSIWGCYRPLQASLFDREFSLGRGIRVGWIERGCLVLFLSCLILSIRSVGVVLVSGMTLAPSIAARQWSHRLSTIFILAALFGAGTGLLGNVLSIALSETLSTPERSFSFPTGPSIILVGTIWALISLLIAPQKGLLFRVFRIGAFRIRCVQENLLKALWKNPELALKQFHRKLGVSWGIFHFSLWKLRRQGWVDGERLTEDGQKRAASIIRLHRLWELYLSESLGFEGKQIHQSAEEMEHILTCELEGKLTDLLSDPKMDPHAQPIPNREETLSIRRNS